MPADRVERLEREADRVDAPWHAEHRASDAVLFDELPHGESLRSPRPRAAAARLSAAAAAFAQEHFADPIAAQDGAGARRAGLLRERCRLGKDAAARDFFMPSTRRHSSHHSRDAVVLREGSFKKV